MRSMKHVVCAISGGVDSSVAALLLQSKGYNLTGVFMRNWDIADEKGFCQTNQDKEDAEFVCKKLNIPFVEVNFVKEYWNEVFSYLIREYEKGFTPNPDILCNKKIKFDAFFKYAMKHLSADAIATGHYARVSSVSGNGAQSLKLLKGVDKSKDQSFFLSQIPKSALEKCIFPLGHLKKSAVKTIAMDAGLDRIVKKRESVGICFIGKRNFQSFIDEYIEPQKGFFVNIENNKVVGEHRGVHCWTVGQRCLIPGQIKAFFVVERNCSTQEILVAPGSNHPSLYHQTLVVNDPYWINLPPTNLQNDRTFKCEFRFQHRKPLVNCLLYQDDRGLLHVFLEKPQRALTPGQFAVFYLGDECLGSGIITTRGPSLYSLNQVQNKESL